MAKTNKNKSDKKEEEKSVQKRTSKYDITVKLDMTFEEAIKLAANTPIKKKEPPKR